MGITKIKRIAWVSLLLAHLALVAVAWLALESSDVEGKGLLRVLFIAIAAAISGVVWFCRNRRI